MKALLAIALGMLALMGLAVHLIYQDQKAVDLNRSQAQSNLNIHIVREVSGIT